jgi:Tol biopolymer transport system component
VLSGRTTGIPQADLLVAPVAPVRLNPDVPPELEDIINKALEKDRNMRYQHAADMRTDLQRLKRDLDTGQVATTKAEKEDAVEKAVGPRSTPRWHATVIAAALVLSIVAGVLYWIYRPRTPVVTSIHQLTRTGRAKPYFYEIHQIASDGTRLYFGESSTDGLRIAQISTKGGEVSYLDIPPIRNPELLGSSTDGSELLVADLAADPSTVVDSPVWRAALPNGPQRKIGGLAVAFAALLPGNRQLVYTKGINLKQLLTSDLEGGNARPLLTAPNEIGLFSVSPDRTSIRFSMANDIWEANLDGSGLHRFLPQYTGAMCCGAWSPDGKIYSFARGEEGINNLWAVTETGRLGRRRVSPAVQLTYGPISFSTPTFSKDGKQIFALGLVQQGELSVYDNASGQFQPYINGLSAGFLDFSPDGQWVAYVAYPQNTLWRSRIDGSERLQLTFPPMGSILNPKWSPDGRLIAFTEWRTTDKKIYVIPANGGSPMLLLSGDFNPSDPTWSPDGKSIAYSGVSIQDGTGTEVRILDLDTKQSRTIPGSQHMFGAMVTRLP